MLSTESSNILPCMHFPWLKTHQKHAPKCLKWSKCSCLRLLRRCFHICKHMHIQAYTVTHADSRIAYQRMQLDALLAVLPLPQLPAILAGQQHDLHMYVCMCVCTSVGRYVYVDRIMVNICMYMCVCMYMYMLTEHDLHVHVFMYVYVCGQEHHVYLYVCVRAYVRICEQEHDLHVHLCLYVYAYVDSKAWRIYMCLLISHVCGQEHYTCTCTYVYVCMCVCADSSMRASITRIYVCTYMYVDRGITCTCMHVFVRVCVYVCLQALFPQHHFLFIYIHIHACISSTCLLYSIHKHEKFFCNARTHTHTHTHTQTKKNQKKKSALYVHKCFTIHRQSTWFRFRIAILGKPSPSASDTNMMSDGVSAVAGP